MEDEEDKSVDESDPEMFDNEAETSIRQQQKNMTMDESEDEPVATEAISDADSPVKKPKQRKLGPKLDDEDSPIQKKKPTPKKRTAKALDSESDEEKPKKVTIVCMYMNCLTYIVCVCFFLIYRSPKQRRRKRISTTAM